MASPVVGPGGAPRARKPMYEDEHATCSVLLAKIRNEDKLLSLPPHDQFRWLHRFYLVLDRIAEQHRVYKLYGGPHGFMISTGVAEPDANHAATLLRFALHLLQAVRAIRLPGMVPLDLIMVLSSGPASSGLLGTTSLTYQIVGRSVSVARELMDTQRQQPFLVTSGMHAVLNPTISSELHQLGRVQLQCCPGEVEVVYSLARYASTPLTQPPRYIAAAPTPAPAATPVPSSSPLGTPRKKEEAALLAGAARPVAGLRGDVAAVPVVLPLLVPSTVTATLVQVAAAVAGDTAVAGPGAAAMAAVPAAEVAEVAKKSKHHLRQIAAERRRRLAAAAGGGSVATPTKPGKEKRSMHAAPTENSLPCNTASSDAWPAADLLLRFEDPVLEAQYARFNSEQQQMGELSWLLLGLFTAALYTAASFGPQTVPVFHILQFQLLPLLGAALWFSHHETYLRWREGLWFAQRFVVLLCTSLPGSHIFSQPGAAPLFAFGMCNLGLEVITRRLRLHLQLLNSLLIYIVALTLMSTHPGDSAARQLISPGYLSLHLLITALGPICYTALGDYSTRLAFQTQLREQLKSFPLLKLQPTTGGTHAPAPAAGVEPSH